MLGDAPRIMEASKETPKEKDFESDEELIAYMLASP